ncbi:septum formation initiator family protein [Desulfallas sp. Bu1-1]|uniref:FtsB family cell division protein n=1 Tax=Desulfallas sp. Bu1-1 TaxID=2787620 RepID=UPI0028BD49F3|nr:septum formation initiator family protein [Desulfallas sp. Bu1-1]
MITGSSTSRHDVTGNYHGDRRRRRVRFRFSRSKLPVIIFTLLLLYVSFSLGSRFDQLYAMQRDLQAIEAEIKEIKEKNTGLQRQLENLQSDAYIEQVAREKLGLVKPGESRIVPVPPEAIKDDGIKD